ncbi:MAG: tetratricopeptide repeat protein [Sinobacterium sp.]|nr:tetratricopeptide repeat protein [Sinobacterium sp.]
MMKTTNVLICSLMLVLLAACSSLDGGHDKPFIEEHKDPQQWLDIARKSYTLGEHQQSLRAYKKVLQSQPDNVLALNGMAQALKNMGDYPNAIIYANKALVLAPGNIESSIIKVKVLIRKGRLDEAEQTLLVTVGDKSDKWKVYNMLGIVHDLGGDYTAAQIAYNKALEINPSNGDTYNNLGYSMIMDKEYSSAISTLYKGLRYTPSSKRLRNNLAIAFAMKGEYSAAVWMLKDYMDEAKAYNNIGYIAMLNHDYDVAEDYLEKAIDASPVYYYRANLNIEKMKSMRQSIEK